MVIRNHVRVEDPVKVQDRPMDFNVTVPNVHWHGVRIYVATDFEKQVLTSFSVVSEHIHNHLKRLLKYLSLFQSLICRPDFLHILQSEQCITTDDRRQAFSSFKLDIKEFVNM